MHEYTQVNNESTVQQRTIQLIHTNTQLRHPVDHGYNRYNDVYQITETCNRTEGKHGEFPFVEITL